VTLSELYRAVAASMTEAFGQILEPGTAEASTHLQGRRVNETRDDVFAASKRAGEALDQYLHERSAKPLAPEDAGWLVAAGANTILAAELLEQLADTGYQAQAKAADSSGQQGQWGQRGQ
jgi:hypothetical protein